MKKGTTRIVFKYKSIVIKIPNFTHNHLNFLNGCYSNWSEYSYCKMFRNMPEFLDKVSPSLYCFPFGLFQIQRYCEPLKQEITEEELEYFKDVCSADSKTENFGIYNNRVVCLDYP